MSLAADEARVVDVAAVLARLEAAVTSVMVVKQETLRLSLIALLSRGHLLFEDVPGVGKTLLARTLAHAVGGDFSRVQFTPDLLPTDVTGGDVFDPRTGKFDFRPGPVFANVVLADEINRGTPRAQSSLLEAMGEGSVSVDGTSHGLPDPFLVIATQNPIEQYGTFPLPESELDRFCMLLRLGQPDESESREILRRHEHSEPRRHIAAVSDLATIRGVQAQVLGIRVSEAARSYIAAVVLATRGHPRVRLPASPRASVAILRTAQASALYDGRDHVLPDDVKSVATAVLSHRLGVGGGDAELVVTEILETVPVRLEP